MATKKKSNSPSLNDVNNALSNIRIFLIGNSLAEEICNDMGFEKKVLYGIPISFSDEIDVAAKTINSNIILNVSLIDEDFNIIMRYVIHELVHAFQHMRRKSDGDPYESYEYLDRPDEMEAFQYQLLFDEEYGVGEDDTVEYVEDLVDYHDVDKKDSDGKKNELLIKTDIDDSINKK